MLNALPFIDGIGKDNVYDGWDDEELLKAVGNETDDVYVIGGAYFYRSMLPYCDEVLVTKVAADGNAEVFFENLDKRSDFKLVEEGEELETNGYKIRFTVYKKI